MSMGEIGPRRGRIRWLWTARGRVPIGRFTVKLQKEAVVPQVVGPVGGNDQVSAPSAVEPGLPDWLTPERLAAERAKVRRETDEILNSE